MLQFLCAAQRALVTDAAQFTGFDSYAAVEREAIARATVEKFSATEQKGVAARIQRAYELRSAAPWTGHCYRYRCDAQCERMIRIGQDQSEMAS